LARWQDIFFPGEPAESCLRRVHFPKVKPAAFAALFGFTDLPAVPAGA
jgi:hypothetical protein